MTHLVLLEPLLEQLLPSLLEDGTRQLDRLQMVQLTLLQ